MRLPTYYEQNLIPNWGKIIRPLYEYQDANLHDKPQFVSLQISEEPKKRLIDHIMVYESCKFKINNYPHRQSF